MGTDALKLAALLEKNPEGLGLLVKEALSRAAGEEQRRRDLLQQPVARLAIGLDQLEEIFTLAERFSIEQRIRFFKAVRAVAESGFGWVVATLRSDFFSRCEEIDDLVELKQGKGAISSFGSECCAVEPDHSVSGRGGRCGVRRRSRKRPVG